MTCTMYEPLLVSQMTVVGSHRFLALLRTELGFLSAAWEVMVYIILKGVFIEVVMIRCGIWLGDVYMLWYCGA